MKCSSAGFWAGGVTPAEPFFYSYIYPQPDGFPSAEVAHGRFDETYGEFAAAYAEVRASDDPERTSWNSSSQRSTLQPILR